MRVRILLPPSEGKTAPTRGGRLDLESLHRPELTDARRAVAEVLAEVSARPDATAVLGVGESLSREVLRNTEPSPRVAPAERVYSGVLYEAFDVSSLGGTALRRARTSTLIFSARFGVVSLGDRIPAYRLSMGTTLPGLGGLAAYWRPRLTPLLDAATAGELLVDARSGGYQAAWRADPSRTVTLRVFTEVDGARKVVTHMAKKTRGEVARHLVERPGSLPSSPRALLGAVAERWHAELVEPSRRAPGHLDIVVPG